MADWRLLLTSFVAFQRNINQRVSMSKSLQKLAKSQFLLRFLFVLIPFRERNLFTRFHATFPISWADSQQNSQYFDFSILFVLKLGK